MMNFSCLSLFLAAALATPASADPLTAARWKNRVLVVVAPSRADANLETQLPILTQASRGMLERDPIMVEAVVDDASARIVRQRLGITGKDFCVLLVGKDGHTAISSETPLTSDYLFKAIDALAPKIKPIPVVLVGETLLASGGRHGFPRR